MPNRRPKRFWRPSQWASWRPLGLGLEHPNNFAELWKAWRANKGRRKYAWKILKTGVCDGCALGTTGMRDWTQEGVHLCNIRLRLLRLNTAPAFDAGLLADIGPLRSQRSDALRDLGRIPRPMVRYHGDGGFKPISWGDALALAADRVGRAGDKIGVYLTARGIPNETYYTSQKAVRALGNNHIDNAARICHSPSTYALKDSLGVGASTCSYADWIGTDLIVFFGSNVANNQPVATKYLFLARKADTKIALVNSYREPGMEHYWIPSVAESALFGTKLTTDFFQVDQGGDIAFIAGAMKHMVAAGVTERSFINAHTDGYEPLAEHLAATSWAELERRSGATRAAMESFGALVGGATSAIFVWSMGITQHAFGEDGVRQIVNLALLRGHVGKEGSGLMPIRGHSGVQGGAEMGCYATAFPGGLPVNAEGAAAMLGHWGFEVPATPGRTAPEMIDAAANGELEVLWSVGGNWLEVLPDPAGVEAALAKVPLRVHHDLVLTRQILIEPPPGGAVLVLPATTRYEIPGGVTQTSTERRIIFSPEVPGPRVGSYEDGARPEGDVLLEVARRVRPGLSSALTFADTAAIRAEIARVVPFYSGIETLTKQGDQVQYGGRRLCEGWVFPTASGKAHFGLVALPDVRVPDGAFRVATRRGKQFNSIVHAHQDRITGAEREAVFMSPLDADRLGLADGAPIVLTSEHGSYSGNVFRAPIAAGNLQVHWPEGNVLLPPRRRSRVSGIPDYNAVVRVAPLPVGDPR